MLICSVIRCWSRQAASAASAEIVSSITLKWWLGSGMSATWCVRCADSQILTTVSRPTLTSSCFLLWLYILCITVDRCSVFHIDWSICIFMVFFWRKQFILYSKNKIMIMLISAGICWKNYIQIFGNRSIWLLMSNTHRVARWSLANPNCDF